MHGCELAFLFTAALHCAGLTCIPSPAVALFLAGTVWTVCVRVLNMRAWL